MATKSNPPYSKGDYVAVSLDKQSIDIIQVTDLKRGQIKGSLYQQQGNDPKLIFKKKDEINLDKSMTELMRLPKTAVKMTKEGMNLREKESDLLKEQIKKVQEEKKKPKAKDISKKRARSESDEEEEKEAQPQKKRQQKAKAKDSDQKLKEEAKTEKQRLKEEREKQKKVREEEKEAKRKEKER